jgi:hypothetical protein
VLRATIVLRASMVLRACVYGVLRATVVLLHVWVEHTMAGSTL